MKLLSQVISSFEDAMKNDIADEAAKRETHLLQTNPIRVVKATPPNNYQKGSYLRDTQLPKRQSSSKSTEEKVTLVSVVGEMNILEKTANTETSYVVHVI